ncbi:MAG: signal peptide peptidase SppA [Fusobacterium sp.]|uniref:signal peptide peptidase SppA n=1 Tax=Fusobacterium sp. TaxID=68766 RepID=UPI0026DC0F26|nr:signal peptide peptidase SppA [Fusobacterium sp.]MDO4690271.1 signal peptide peptidase SppA [Fusobacterium sp.]
MKILKWFFNFLKSIILFIVKEIFSFFIKFALFLFFIIIIFVAILEKEERPKIKKDIYVTIDLGEKIREKGHGKHIFEEESINFYSLIKNVMDINFNDNVKGIVLKLNGVSLSYAQLEELGKELAEIKENKNIDTIAYMEDVNRKNLYIASFVDKIYMPKTHSTVVNIFPYFKESFYKKNLLDKLGLKVNIVNTGDYKSYGEDLASSQMSKENREDTTRILNENYQHFLDVVSENLKYNRESLDKIIKEGELVAASSQDLFDKKIINGYIYWDELLRNIGEERIVSLGEYAKNYSVYSYPRSNNKIYVLALEGEIIHYDEDIFDNMFIGSTSIIKNLDKLEKDGTVKGVVLRIDSPGGSALTSDKINNRIKEFIKKKPIYVSMGTVAASGGYYISSNATKIFADENTITGSIGVVSIIPNFSELLKKVGINNEKISEGNFADLYSSEQMTEEKYNKILKSNLKVYDDFLNEVAEGRKIPREKLEKIAEGRIWTGREAVQIGLVDEVGGLSDSIFSMVTDLQLDEDFEVVFLEEKLDVKNLYKKYSRFLKKDALNLIKNKLYDENMYNKPILYMPYEILE